MIRKHHWIAAALLLLAAHPPWWAFSQPAREQPSGTPAAAGETSGALRPDRPSVLEGSEPILESMEAIEKYLATTEEKEEPADPNALRLTARRAVELALTQNAGALVAQDDVEAARARIGQARSALLPQAKASVTFLHTEFNNTDISSLGGGAAGLSGIAGTGGLGSVGGLGGVAGLGNLGGLGGALGGGGGLGGLSGGLGQGGLFGSGPIAPRLFLSFLTQPIVERLTPEIEDDFRVDTLQISQALYAGGQIRAAVRASQYLAESQEWQKAATFAKLEFDAKQAFYDAAASEALVRVAEASVTTFERNLTDAQNMFEAGLISNFEVLRAKTEVGSRKANLVEARNVRRLALANLRRVIGAPQNAPLVLEPKLDWLPFTPDPPELVREAYANRPEILALEKAIAAAKEDIRRAKGQYKPGVGADIRYQNVDNAGFAQPDGWTFSLGAQWDISTGGKRKSEVLEAQARLRSLEHQLDDLHALVELDVTAAIIQIRDAMARISSENGTRALAQEGLRLAELRFQEGAGTQSETLDAELALTNAETSLVQALRDFAVANSSLERAVGRSWIQPEDEPKPADASRTSAGTESAGAR